MLIDIWFDKRFCPIILLLAAFNLHSTGINCWFVAVSPQYPGTSEIFQGLVETVDPAYLGR